MDNVAKPDRWVVTWAGSWNTDFNGERTITARDELPDLLAMRDLNGDAEFIIAPAVETYPQLVINTHADRCYLHFFADASDPGSPIVGDNPSSEDFVRMPAGSDIEASGASLVSPDSAARVAMEFIESGVRPTSVEWFDL